MKMTLPLSTGTHIVILEILVCVIDAIIEDYHPDPAAGEALFPCPQDTKIQARKVRHDPCVVLTKMKGQCQG